MARQTTRTGRPARTHLLRTIRPALTLTYKPPHPHPPYTNKPRGRKDEPAAPDIFFRNW